MRLGIASTFVLVMFGLLFARFVYLQVVMHDHYHTLAEANRISILPIVPNRGIIVDRNGVVLAHNYSAYTLEITPSKVDNLESTIDELATLVEITPRDRRRFKKLLEESKRFESLPIRTRLTDEEIARFAANRYRFPGRRRARAALPRVPAGRALLARDRPHRPHQPEGPRPSSRAEGRISNYRGTDYIGKTGLEHSYEDQLHGTTGVEQVEVDSGGRAVRSLSRTPPISGNNLVLKLDARLQEVVYRAFGERRGALVAIEPATGGVLAFVSKPGFDPNLFVDGIDPQNWNELNNSPDKPMVNRALHGTYPPGSTFKPFMALAALTYGKRTPEPGDLRSRAISTSAATTSATTRSAVTASSTCTSRSSSRATPTTTCSRTTSASTRSRASWACSASAAAPASTSPAKSAGVLPSQEWKRKRFSAEQQKWYAGETISIGIGQGYNSYTPLQLAAATATLANDGVMFRPHIVNYVEDVAQARAHARSSPSRARTLDVKREHIAIVKNAMVGVNKEGTGARAFAGAPYTHAGKTGTAQVIA